MPSVSLIKHRMSGSRFDLCKATWGPRVADSKRLREVWLPPPPMASRSRLDGAVTPAAGRFFFCAGDVPADLPFTPVRHSPASPLAGCPSKRLVAMSGGGAARLAVFPTRQNLQVMKVKLTGAKKGHSLLKKKADALTMRLRLLLKNILTVRPASSRTVARPPLPAERRGRGICLAQAKEEMGSAMKEGNFALAEVKYAAGDIKPMVIESVGTAQKRVEIRVDNIAGVKVPVFKPVDTGAVSQDHTGTPIERAPTGGWAGTPCAIDFGLAELLPTPSAPLSTLPLAAALA